MKLHLNTFAGQYSITGHGAGFVKVGADLIHSPLVVTPDHLIAPWALADATAPRLEDFAAVLALEPTLVVFGSGSGFRFPDPAIAAAFSKRRIGFEVMDTPAACRTFNVLIAEGRRVAAALLV